MDYIKVGYFLGRKQADLLIKKNLKHLIQFQNNFPNAVIIIIDFDLFQTDNYPIRCFRLGKPLMDMVDQIAIEESENQDIFKVFCESQDLLKFVNFTIREDVYNVFSSLVDKKACENRNESYYKINHERNALFKRV